MNATNPLTNQPSLKDAETLRKRLSSLQTKNAQSKGVKTLVQKANPAVDYIRQKVNAIYNKEPDPKEIIREGAALPAQQRSKHQAYMQELSSSGLSLAEIQVAWHKYYLSLPDIEKHEVWREFYDQHRTQSNYWHHLDTQTPQVSKPAELKPLELRRRSKKRHSLTPDPRSVSDIRSSVLKQVSANGRLKAKHHFQALLFGVGTSAVVVMILLFGLFNERFIAPFVSPSRTVSSAPIIIDPNNLAVGPEPKVIIPKINVETPVVYGVESVEEKDIQDALENGVVHFGPTPEPGQQGNVVILGHSASNIFNRGKFKFAFILLKSLDTGDTFTLNKDGKQYVYRVFEKRIVEPTDVSVLGPSSKPSTATLITCDPPGLSTRRLIIVGEQIVPDPAANAAAAPAGQFEATPTKIPSDSPSLFSRLFDWF